MEHIEIEDGMVLEVLSPTAGLTISEIAEKTELGVGAVMNVLSRQQRAGRVLGIDHRWLRAE